MVSEISTQLIEGEHARLELDSARVDVTAGPDRGQKIQLLVVAVHHVRIRADKSLETGDTVAVHVDVFMSSVAGDGPAHGA